MLLGKRQYYVSFYQFAAGNKCQSMQLMLECAYVTLTFRYTLNV